MSLGNWAKKIEVINWAKHTHVNDLGNWAKKT
jgi:hypothetical protein